MAFVKGFLLGKWLVGSVSGLCDVVRHPAHTNHWTLVQKCDKIRAGKNKRKERSDNAPNAGNLRKSRE